MTDFLDVPGASAARYRFRRASLADLPVGAGNVVAVTGVGGSRKVIFCATARSLARAAGDIRNALAEHGQVAVFIRLNVARATRETEHADIVAAARPALIFDDLG